MGKKARRRTKSKRPSLADVAEVAGVSKATVSLVLNGKAEELAISDATRRNVIDAARKIDYRPRMPKIFEGKAGQLVRHISLAFVNPAGSSDHEFLATAFLEIAQTAGEEDLLIHATEGVRPEEVERFCKRQIERGTDGVILFTFYYELDEWLTSIRDSGIPFVVFNRDFGPDYPSVVMDHQGQASDQVGMLVEAGHQRIACLGKFHTTSKLRLEGYRDRLNRAGIYDPALERETAYDVDLARQAGRQLLKDHPDITAVFCTTDVVALGMQRAASDEGFRVPDDLSITSMDGYEFGKYASPPLTTIRYPRAEMGRAAVKLLRQIAIGRPPSSTRIMVRGERISGGCVGSPRKGKGNKG